jgi:hypothetical protein
MVRLQFDTRNAAFDDAPATEIGRILRDIASKVERGESFGGKIMDANGNAIGQWQAGGGEPRDISDFTTLDQFLKEEGIE